MTCETIIVADDVLQVVTTQADPVVVVDHVGAVTVITEAVPGATLLQTVEAVQVISTQAPESVHVITTAEQGPPGRDGVGSTTLSYPAPFAISGHRVVVLDTAGLLAYADPTNPAHARRVVGLTLHAASEGADVTVQWFGEVVEPSWAFDVALPVLIGPGGTLVQAVGPGAFAKAVGFPIAPGRLFINLQPAVRLA